MRKTIIVMPVANEEESMGRVIEVILSLPYDNLLLFPVIDSFSKDNTEEIIRSYESTGRVKCVFNEKSKGAVSCYYYGFKIALENGAEYVIEMDGGGSHNPKEIPQFIQKLEEGYECVYGSRFINNGGNEHNPLYRKMLSYGGTVLSNLILGTNLHDMTSGFEAFTREVLEAFDFDQFLSLGHMYQTEMKYYCRNYKCIEVPIHYVGGKSGLKLKSVTEALRILFQLKRNEKNVRKQSS